MSNPIRIEGKTAYVATATQALEASWYPGVEDVVIEDTAERIKMLRLVRGFRD